MTQWIIAPDPKLQEEYLDKRPARAGRFYQPNAIDKIKGLISGRDQTKLALGIDTSHWTGTLTRELIRQFDFVCPKLCDGNQVRKGNWADLSTFKDDQADTTIQLAYEEGKGVIPFHYFQSIYDQWNKDQVYKFQFDIILAAIGSKIPGKSYHGFAIDIEEKGDTDTNMADKVRGLWTLMKGHPKFEGIPIWFYSSMYFLNMWPALSDWLSYKNDYTKPLWMAQWVFTNAFAGDVPTFRQKVLPNINMSVRLPGNAPKFTAVQWTATPIFYGFNCDVNSYNGTPEQFRADLKVPGSTPPTPTPTPEPTPTPTAGARSEIIAVLDKYKVP